MYWIWIGLLNLIQKSIFIIIIVIIINNKKNIIMISEC